jgi:hypothetical protein
LTLTHRCQYSHAIAEGQRARIRWHHDSASSDKKQQSTLNEKKTFIYNGNVVSGPTAATAFYTPPDSTHDQPMANRDDIFLCNNQL